MKRYTLDDGTTGTAEELAAMAPGGVTAKAIRHRLRKTNRREYVLMSPKQMKHFGQQAWRGRYRLHLPNTPPKHEQQGA
ncbi:MULTISPECIES: hypothetical protein [unclassified Thioalkalivibrio]|uniref:hypothetical protein n=1 Tax=unclassified Thioalkalivibrio TaxID=2621013 RepID=UPI000382F032|nr:MULTISPECIES: hypothetical protein [unclassified Thioalkalivibrio]